MKKKLSVTIGIPAFNEERNIALLLASIFSQNENKADVKEIIVISDGSTDSTVEEIKKNEDRRIKLIVGRKRLGKPERLNQLFEIASADFFVLLDGDIVIKSKDLIDKLVKPMIENENIDLTAGAEKPLKENSFVEKLAGFSFRIWEDAIKMAENSEMYYCSGAVRGFRKRLYKDIKFPSLSADDVFAFLYCQKKKKGFRFVEDAIVYFYLPSVFKDFIRQNKRFLQSKKVQLLSFGEHFINSYYTVNLRIKLKVLMIYFHKNFIWTFVYVIFFVLLRLLLIIKNEGTESRWEIAKSTKR